MPRHVSKLLARIASVYLVRVRAVRNAKDEKADTAVCLPWALLRQQRVDCVGEREHRIGDIVEAHGRGGFHLHAICSYAGRPCGHQPSTKVSVVVVCEVFILWGELLGAAASNNAGLSSAGDPREDQMAAAAHCPCLVERTAPQSDR